MTIFGDKVLGFILFGVVLMFTVGVRFLLNLAMALFSALKREPAKVELFSSGLYWQYDGQCGIRL